MSERKVTIIADGYKFSGPRVDGSYTVTFTIGEYMGVNLIDLVKTFKPNEVVLVEVKPYSEKGGAWKQNPNVEEKETLVAQQ